MKRLTLGGLVKWLLPTNRQIFLHETMLHGANYYTARDLIKRDEIHVSDVLILRREAQNPHDEHAVAVYTCRGQKLAYLQKAQNHIIASLLDNDQAITARISKVLPSRHEPITIKLWLVIH